MAFTHQDGSVVLHTRCGALFIASSEPARSFDKDWLEHSILMHAEGIGGGYLGHYEDTALITLTPEEEELLGAR